ncbi:MAG: beta-lactamase family protein [Acidobacteria bacterium]|nr:beta-lactamase family protein [Acidobacteriota bacterium]
MKNGFLSVLALAACTGPVLAADPAEIPPRQDYGLVTERLSQFIQREMKNKRLPAISVALVDDQQIVWARGFGYADPGRKIPATARTVYRIGSVSKLFTDIGIMQLVEKGKINLDAPVAAYISDFKPDNQFGKPITLRQLMSHRSGLLREPPVGHYFDPTEPTLKATVLSLNGHPLVYPPETRVKYSNAGISVVGYVLEKLSGRPFAAYLKNAVVKPMGLSSSAFEPEPGIRQNLAKAYMWTYEGRVFQAPTFQLGMAPAGSMYSTVTDLGRFASVLFAGGRGVLKPETIREMWTTQFPKAGGPRSFGIGFVLGQLDGHRTVGHAGAVYGFATEMKALPDDKLAAIAVTTMDSANAVTAHIAEEALRLMLAARAKRALPAIPETQPVPPEMARRIAGRYGATEDKALDLTIREGKLKASWVRGGYEMEVRRLGNDLIMDDRLAWGPKIVPAKDAITVNGETLRRTAPPNPAPVPKQWQGLVGEYGWDHDILYILVRDGRLSCLIEWYEYEPLDPVSHDVFRNPARGLYDKEDFVFQRGPDGRATQVTVGAVAFKRR